MNEAVRTLCDAPCDRDADTSTPTSHENELALEIDCANHGAAPVSRVSGRCFPSHVARQEGSARWDLKVMLNGLGVMEGEQRARAGRGPERAFRLVARFGSKSGGPSTENRAYSQSTAYTSPYTIVSRLLRTVQSILRTVPPRSSDLVRMGPRLCDAYSNKSFIDLPSRTSVGAPSATGAASSPISSSTPATSSSTVSNAFAGALRSFSSATGSATASQNRFARTSDRALVNGRNASGSAGSSARARGSVNERWRQGAATHGTQ